MSKLLKSLFILYTLLIFSCIPQFITGFVLNRVSLYTNKNYYYMYENIEIYAEWELYYAIGAESCFVQINIYNISEDLIWHSCEYSNVGFNSESWIIYIPDLNLLFINESTPLYVKFCLYHDDGEKVISTSSEAIDITILKSDLSCELFGFKNSIMFGENLNFSVIFFETGNNSLLINQKIYFNIKFNNKTTFLKEFSTNETGKITLHLSSLTELNLGENILNFIINESTIYEPIHFLYKLDVIKIPILIDTIRCEKDDLKDRLIYIELLYYYFFNGVPTYLSNRTILVKIFQNTSLRTSFYLKTNITGSLIFKLLYSSLDLEKNLSKFKIQFIFNGTTFLENKTSNIELRIENLNPPIEFDSVQFISVSGLITSLIIFGILFTYKNIEKKKRLEDLYIKT
ncbi:MAG: hypothetical protein EU532_13750 [Promethearchaeota archaeon]|nr:MAG: hypothetical protein EU532_13750 [Candidatus Lokiarchaeota archaeon]